MMTTCAFPEMLYIMPPLGADPSGLEALVYGICKYNKN